MNILKKLLFSVIIAGVIILLIGLYYLVIKAGIPYQDPTPELQFKYSVNMKVGETLTLLGFVITTAATLCRIIIGIISSEKK